MDFPWIFHGIAMQFSRNGNENSIIILRKFHVNQQKSMEISWKSCGMSTKFHSIAVDFVAISQNFHGIAMEFLRTLGGTSTEFQEISIEFLKDFDVFFMELPWNFCGISIELRKSMHWIDSEFPCNIRGIFS